MLKVTMLHRIIVISDFPVRKTWVVLTKIAYTAMQIYNYIKLKTL